MRHRPQLPSQPARHPRWQDHKMWSGHASAIQLSGQLVPGDSPAVSYRREKAQRADWRPRGPRLPADALSPGHWPKAQRQSIGTARGFVTGSLATHRFLETTACPTLGYLQRPGDTRPANRRANRPAADINGLLAGPTVS